MDDRLSGIKEAGYDDKVKSLLRNIKIQKTDHVWCVRLYYLYLVLTK